MSLAALRQQPLASPPAPGEAVAVLGLLALVMILAWLCARWLRPRPAPGEAAGGRRDGLRRRFASLGLLALVLGTAVTAGGWLFLGFLALCTVLAARELETVVAGLGGAGGRPRLWALAAVPVLAVPAGPMAVMAGTSLALLAAAPVALRPAPGAAVLARLGALFAGLLLIALPAAMLGLIRQPPAGYVLTAALVLIPQVADGFALLSGRRWGRHRLAPRLSAGKTWQGLLGGLVAGILMALALSPWLAGIGAGAAVVLGLVLVLAGLAGDLSASMLKRAAGVDDFGRLLPGHGGLFDRLDSLAFAIPLGWLTHALLAAA